MERPYISTHVLDTSRGTTVCDLEVILYKKVDDIWITINKSVTNTKGRCEFLNQADQCLSSGCYKLVFGVEDYFLKLSQTAFYPSIQVEFNVYNTEEHYHLPILLNPFGFSTYRGSA